MAHYLLTKFFNFIIKLCGGFTADDFYKELTKHKDSTEQRIAMNNASLGNQLEKIAVMYNELFAQHESLKKEHTVLNAKFDMMQSKLFNFNKWIDDELARGKGKKLSPTDNAYRTCLKQIKEKIKN